MHGGHSVRIRQREQMYKKWNETKCSKKALKQKEKPVVYSQINMVKRSSKAIATENVFFFCYIKQFDLSFCPRERAKDRQ